MIVGARVEHRIIENLAAEPGDRDQYVSKVTCTGLVVACERSGAPAAFHALVMLDDGTLKEYRADQLTVVDLSPRTAASWQPKHYKAKDAKDKKPDEVAP